MRIALCIALALISTIASAQKYKVVVDKTAYFQIDLYNDFDKTYVSEKSQGLLSLYKAELIKNPELNISIQGFTDKNGETAYNSYLADLRAKWVKGYLVNNGVDSSRIKFLPSILGVETENRKNRKVQLTGSRW